MTSEIQEGAAPIVGDSAGSPVDKPIPPTAEPTAEDKITVPVDDDAIAAVPEGQTISVVSTSTSVKNSSS